MKSKSQTRYFRGEFDLFINIINNRYGSKKGIINYLKYYILRLTGKYNYSLQIDLDKIDRFVFVCSGNICRSALGESVMKKLGGLAASFGLDTRGGDPADPRMIKFGDEHGYDLSKHITQSITRFQPQPHDLLIGMEPSHIEQLHTQFPNHQTTALGLWLPQMTVYLHDPYSANMIYFKHCAESIVTATTTLYNLYSKKLQT